MLPPKIQAATIIRYASSLASNHLGVLSKIRAARGDLFRTRFPLNAVFVFHPDQVHEVLSEHSKSFKRQNSYRFARDVFGDGLLSSDGESWRKQRKTVGAEFHRSHVLEHEPLIREQADAFIERSRAGETIDLGRAISRMLIEVVFQGLFDHETPQAAEQVMQLTRRFGKALLARMLLPYSWYDKVPWRHEHELKEVLATTHSLVDRMAERCRAGGGERVSVLSRILSQEADRDVIRGQVVTLILSGYETTSTALMWCFYHVLSHEEATRDLTRLLRSAEKAKADRMLDLLILESLRLSPSVPTISRDAVEDVAFGSYVVPKGIRVVTSPYVTHRHEEFWPHPERFEPTRFEKFESTERAFAEKAYFPFGTGPRACIGQHLAMLEMRTLIARLLERADWKLSEDSKKMKARPRLMLTADRPLMAKLVSKAGE